jgi:hypothetical protein
VFVVRHRVRLYDVASAGLRIEAGGAIRWGTSRPRDFVCGKIENLGGCLRLHHALNKKRRFAGGLQRGQVA